MHQNPWAGEGHVAGRGGKDLVGQAGLTLVQGRGTGGSQEGQGLGAVAGGPAVLRLTSQWAPPPT